MLMSRIYDSSENIISYYVFLHKRGEAWGYQWLENRSSCVAIKLSFVHYQISSISEIIWLFMHHKTISKNIYCTMLSKRPKICTLSPRIHIINIIDRIPLKTKTLSIPSKFLSMEKSINIFNLMAAVLFK